MQAVPTFPRSTLEPAASDVLTDNIADNIRLALRGLQFGEITITVRNGSVIQIDRVARKRQFKSRQSD